jgi:hypothetical protein
VIHLAQLRHDIRRGMNANVEDKVLRLCHNTLYPPHIKPLLGMGLGMDSPRPLPDIVHISQHYSRSKFFVICRWSVNQYAYTRSSGVKVEFLHAKTLSQFHHSLAEEHFVTVPVTFQPLPVIQKSQSHLKPQHPTSSPHHIIMGDNENENENDYRNSENEFWLFGYGYGTK